MTDQKRTKAFVQEFLARPLDLTVLQPKIPEGFESWEDYEKYGDILIPLEPPIDTPKEEDDE